MRSANPRALLGVLAAVTATGLVGPGAPAAQGGPDDDAPTLISEKFHGGSAAQFIAAIRRVANELNVVVAAEASEITIPAMTLNGVTPPAALNLVDGTTYQSRGGRSVKLTVKHMRVYSPHERPTYQIVATVRGQTASTNAGVWTLAGVLESGIGSEAVLSAIQLALEVLGSGTPADVRFHEETALLIARGDADQLQTIHEVLDRLQDALEAKHRMAALDTERRRVIEALSTAESQRNQAQEELRVFHRETERMEVETERMEVRIAELQRMLDGKERELAATTARLRALAIQLEHQRKPQGVFSPPDD